MKILPLKITAFWLLLGPAMALAISFVSWSILKPISPDKLSDATGLVTTYPLGLLMSLLTPWGWLMYGGFMAMLSERRKLGIFCTAAGAVMLGAFWPIWCMDLIGAI
ncbi:MAG: hypothetical protein GY792_36150 [Gammaproteobacteria bacterium]|nr:hypothetical protein [Gammaproteobacteria bacterium]